MVNSMFYQPAPERTRGAPRNTAPLRERSSPAADNVINLGAPAEEAPLIDAAEAIDLGPLRHARPNLPKMQDPDDARRRALVDALDDGMTAPTVSGSVIEGLTRGGESFFRARAARDDREREQGDRTEAERRDYEQRGARVDALNAAQDFPDDPEARNNAVIQALAGGDQEAALEMLQSRTGQQLEMADAVDLQERIGPLETQQRLMSQGYRETGEGEYERFGPAADDWEANRQQIGLGYARMNDDGRREELAENRAEAGMRGQFLQGQQNFIATRDAYATIRGLADRQRQLIAGGQPPSATTDMSMVFSFMKLLDPTSVVREGEYANAQNAAGVPERVRNMYNRAANGSFLDPNQRSQFLNDATGIYTTRAEQHERDRTLYSDIGTRSGYDSDDVAPDLRLPGVDLAAAIDTPDASPTMDGRPMSAPARAGMDPSGNAVSPRGTQRVGPDGRTYTKLNDGPDNARSNWRQVPRTR